MTIPPIGANTGSLLLRPLVEVEFRIRDLEATMETRPYFVLGDLLANAMAGTLVGLAMAALFGPSWNMFLAMFVGMALGMALSLFVALPMGALFGAMEVMVPVMTTGMVSGMVVSMAATMTAKMEPLSFSQAAELGLYSGIATLAACYVANAWIRGKASRWTT
jgi:hypothetical protein